MGKALENGVFEQSGHLQQAPRLVMTALSSMKSDPYLPQAPLQEYIQEIMSCKKNIGIQGRKKTVSFPATMRTIPDTRPATCAVRLTLPKGQIG